MHHRVAELLDEQEIQERVTNDGPARGSDGPIAGLAAPGGEFDSKQGAR